MKNEFTQKDLFPQPRPKKAIETMKAPDREAIQTPRRIHLHLCCEGWQKFGPFEWLSFKDDPRVIVDETGTVIASWDGQAWKTSGPQYENYAWENPTITIGSCHPHQDSGAHPHFPNS